MRSINTGDVLSARAIGGLHVVTLAWDFVEGQQDKHNGLLGFAIERSELKDGEVVERYYLRGIKRFKLKDEGLAPGTPMPTSEHPIQSFQWGDYTANPATDYRFKVIPVYGKPKLLELDEASAVTVDIRTEAEEGKGADHAGARHDVYFNRGVAGSQAYARKFGKSKPDEDHPESEQMAWLSRGLFEALTDFIKLANGSRYKLRAMLYEFRYLPVGKAFAAAAKTDADVSIYYEAQSYKVENEEMIAKARIKRLCKPQRSRGGIRHNKFIVLIRDDKPVAVWTGSTNISAGGIFGHSNVGHAIWDEDIAERYLQFWTRLADEGVTAAVLKEENLESEPTPQLTSAPPTDRMLALFSPREEQGANDTLQWYGNLIGSARRMVCMTFAFNLDDVFHEAFGKKGQILRYAVFDKSPGAEVEDEVYRVGNTVIAPGAKLGKGDMENFLGEQLTGFNRNLYIHDKFILIDPLGDDPIVVTGSANFSNASQRANDENMIVIRGNTRIGDIYLGEFMRVFDHLYSRYIVKKLKAEGKNDPDAGYLKEQTAEWLPKHLRAGAKQLRRKYFMGA